MALDRHERLRFVFYALPGGVPIFAAQYAWKQKLHEPTGTFLLMATIKTSSGVVYM
jgi:hypothetical protein